MNLFVWTEALATGNGHIDDDHHELVRRINAVLEAIALQQTGPALGQAVSLLIAFVHEHFAREEAEMQRIQFVHQQVHREAHTALIRQLQEQLNAIQASQIIDQMGLYTFLTWWIKDHIRDMDQALADALAAKN
jgi:methyl-accepting chemotaxis protein